MNLNKQYISEYILQLNSTNEFKVDRANKVKLL